MDKVMVGDKVSYMTTGPEGVITKVGELISINSRFAAIMIDGTIKHVGKTKIKKVVGSTNCRTSTGRLSKDNSDFVATMLRGKDLMHVYQIGSEYLGISVDELMSKYRHLNNGQQRMCIGNRIRKIARNNGDVCNE